MRKGKSPRPLIRRGFRIGLGANERAISVRRWKEESSFFYSSRSFFFLCGNGSKERTVPGTWNDVYIYPRHVTLEVWSKCSGKMEKFFPKGREKGFLRDARGDEIYMEEFWKNISFSTGEREGHLSCSFRVETLGGGEEVVFGEKLKGVLVNNAINICEH